MIWIEGVDNFKIFIDYLNIHSTIKFTSSSRRMVGHHYLFMSTEAAKFEYGCN